MNKKIYIVHGYENKDNEEIYWIEDIFENEEQAKACCKYFSIRNDNVEYDISEHEICTNNYVKDLESIKQGEWLLVDGENFMNIQPQFCCSVCKNMISTYYPPNVCKHCGSINKNKGNSILVRIDSDEDEYIVPSPKVLHDKATLETQKDAINEINDLLKHLKV